MKNRVVYIVAVLFVLLAGFAKAQENDEGTPPSQLGPYHFCGDLKLGFLSSNVTGLEGRTSDTWAQRLFHEQYQYDPTKKIPAFDLNLYGEQPTGGAGIFDQMFLNTSYNGANFLGSLRFRGLGKYDFKVDYTRSTYFYDHFDSIYTDLHQYDQTRNRLTASLTVTPVSMLDINVLYAGNGRSGNQQVSRSPELNYGGAGDPLQT